MPAEKILIKLDLVFKKFDLVFKMLDLVFKIIGKNYCEVLTYAKLSQPSPKSNPTSNLGLAGQHNWSEHPPHLHPSPPHPTHRHEVILYK